MSPEIDPVIPVEKKASCLALAIGALCVALAAFPLQVSAQQAGKRVEIKKCQDADGKWHYGDTAADECARSKITVIDKRGLKVEEVGAPPTAEELERRKIEAAEQQEADAKAEQEKRARERILSIYDSEAAIFRARDERLGHIDRQIATYKDMSGRLQQRLEKARSTGAAPEAIKVLEDDIGAFEGAIATSEQQRSEIMERYGQDLELYRALKQSAK